MISGTNIDIKVGNCLPLSNIPVGTIVHNIELKVNKGAAIARSAGASAQLLAKDDQFAQLKLPSVKLEWWVLIAEHVLGK